jgi:hypothetical protein
MKIKKSTNLQLLIKFNTTIHSKFINNNNEIEILKAYTLSYVSKCKLFCYIYSLFQYYFIVILIFFLKGCNKYICMYVCFLK